MTDALDLTRYEVLGDLDRELPPTAKQQRAQDQAERMAAHIKAVVDDAPPLSAAQAARLQALLQPALLEAPLQPEIIWRLRLYCGILSS